MARVFANVADDVLNAGISAGATSSTLTDASEFPATGDFSIRFESAATPTTYEIVNATARTGNTITHAATANAWAAGDKVYQVVAKDDLDAFLQSGAPASAISIADAGNDFTATDVEGALAELQSDHEADSTALSDHIADATAAHAGTAISNTPAGNIAATTVQAAINELDSEKSATAHTHTETQTLLYSRAGTLATGTGTFRVYAPGGATWTISEVRASVGTAPTGASLIVDVHKSGTTIFTTQSNRPTIAVSTNTDLANAIEVTSFASGEYLTVDIDQVGSTVAGADITVQIYLTRSV